MPKAKIDPNSPQPAKTKVSTADITQWETDFRPGDIPYVSHVPKSPIKMSKERKERIKRIVYYKNLGKTPEQIAEALKVDVKTVKRDLTTAIVLMSKNMPFIPAQDRALMREAVKTYADETKELIIKTKNLIDEIEQNKMHLEPKALGGFALMLGELRQTLELGAKLSGELQTGPKVNVIVFSGLIKRLIEIINEEVDRTAFIRIRDRFKLEMGGKEPLGEKGGKVEVEEIDGEINVQ